MANRTPNAQSESVQEEWRPVVGYEGLYEVSDLGRVRSLDRMQEFEQGGRLIARRQIGRVRRLHMHKGYLHVGLWNETGATKAVHVLVAEAFLGPRPHGMQAAHNDGNPQNSNVSNLRWATPVENSHDALLHGVRPKGETCGLSKLTAVQVREIRGAVGVPHHLLAQQYGVRQTSITAIIQNRSWYDPEYDPPPKRHSIKVRLSDEQKADIRAFTGLSQKVLAEKFGVSQSFVCNIRRGNS